jgi:hypothetical protein
MLVLLTGRGHLGGGCGRSGTGSTLRLYLPGRVQQLPSEPSDEPVPAPMRSSAPPRRSV